MKISMVILALIGVVAGCSPRGPTLKDNPSQNSSDTNAIQRDDLPSLSSLIGRQWEDVWQRFSADGVAIVETREAQDGTSEHILRNVKKNFGNVRLFVRNGVIDEVEAWAENALAPYFSTVVGVVQPGIPVDDIEREHGEPSYVEFGHHGLRMKGWKVDDYLVFVESNDGMFLTPAAGRVYAFHKDHLPSTRRMWSLKGRTTLQSLIDGKTHIEKR
jgi:hypothetical protein